MLTLPSGDHAAPPPQLDIIPKLLNAVFKWKWLIVLVMFAVAVPVALVLYLKTPLYEVRMKILIKSARAQHAFNLGGQSVVTPAVTLAIVNSEIQLLKSPDLLLPAIQQSGYPLLAPGQEDTPITRERAFQALRARMNFNTVPDSNVIDVSIQDPDARQAARLLNTLAAVYLKKHAELQAGGENTPAFFDSQVKFHRDRVEQSREVLEKFQERDNIISIGQETEQNLFRLMAMEGTLKDLQAEIQSTTSEVAALEALRKEHPDEITKERSVVLNPEVTVLRSKLVDLERQRDELLQRYTPQSRFVKDKEAEIAALKASIEAKDERVAGGTVFARNSTKELLQQQIAAKKATLEAVAAKRKALIEEKRAYEQRLDVLKDRSFELGRLRGEFDLARDNYLMYEKKAEEARVSRAMDEENIVNAGVVQQAVAPVISLPRNLLIWGPVSAVAGAILGVALALGLEFFNLTIKDETDVERFLQVPVLATVRHF